MFELKTPYERFDDERLEVPKNSEAIIRAILILAEQVEDLKFQINTGLQTLADDVRDHE